MPRQSKLPVDVISDRLAIEPAAVIERWRQRNLEVADWVMSGEQTLRYGALPHHTIAVCLRPCLMHHLSVDGQLQRSGPVLPNRFRIAQAKRSVEAQFKSEQFQALHIYFSQGLLAHLFSERASEMAAIEFIDPQFDVEDPVIGLLAANAASHMFAASYLDLVYAEHCAILAVCRAVLKYSNAPAIILREGPSKKSLADMKPVINFMRDAELSKVNLTELAAVANMSPFHFIRSFKRVTGKSPILYLRDLRLDKAKDLIENTSLPIAIIADRIGFSSVSHFSTAFRKSFGVSPREARALRR